MRYFEVPTYLNYIASVEKWQIHTRVDPRLYIFQGVLKARSVLAEDFGNVHMNFCDPVSIRRYSVNNIDRTVHSLAPRFVFNSVCWVVFYDLYLSSADFFQINFSEKLFRCQTVWIQIRPNFILGPDPDQAQHFVGPNLGPNCLQRLSADDKTVHWQSKS